jgi:sterol desaturase/sphingolipid hydroxylase (fatty acid hydroxylase superfamily)
MSDTLLDDEPFVRVAVFVATLAAMCLWELVAPRRPHLVGRWTRWPSNLGIVVISTVLLRLLLPIAAAGVALAAERHGWGLFQVFLHLPMWAAVIASIVLMDLAIYLQHVLFHHVPLLWRLHRMHHSDLDLDVTTGVRFHPVEIVLSALLRVAIIAALGAPVLAVVLFEIVLNASSMFNHANVRIPPWIEALLRPLLVTPQMHEVHHSIRQHETNSNFGFNVPWWDRLFGTYRASAETDHGGLVIGIEQFRDERELSLWRLLTQPVRLNADSVPASTFAHHQPLAGQQK